MFDMLGDAFLMVEGDRRTFAFDPWWPFLIALLYVLLVKVVGPAFMKNRAPYKLKNILLLYNAIQVALNTYLFVLIGSHGWWSISNWFKCKPIDEMTSPRFQHLLGLTHWYYILKYIDLLDTVFFVVRKKYSQVSFPHVYHHGSMPLFTCLLLRYSPGSSVSFIGFLNSFVHVVMYGYYLLAAMGPWMQKYLGWKKYITSIQLIHFLTIFVHFTIVLSSSCNVPKGVAIFVLLNTVFNFALFYYFNRREYQQKMKENKTHLE